VPVTIGEPTTLTASITAQTEVSCNGGNNGSVTITASNGTPAYQYNIGTGNQTGGVFTGLTAGGYVVTVTDANGCTTAVPVTINQNPPTTVDAGIYGPVCETSGLITL
ncbi:MAG TPA: SprB repeat-containing protein, partial [Chitinophagales bacterium]|nr:SprB repeat-containing protein [Chitinophagales bacterium]